MFQGPGWGRALGIAEQKGKERSRGLQARKAESSHQDTSFRRSVKGTSLNQKKKTTTRNEKIIKENLIVKGRYTVKLLQQSLTKLAGKLKTT